MLQKPFKPVFSKYFIPEKQNVIRNIDKCRQENHQEKEVCSFGRESGPRSFCLE